MSAERIDLLAFPPTLIQFRGRCLTVLRADLAAVVPEEGCALLLGSPRTTSVITVERIWPCRNIWMPAAERHCRFALDPREQIAAQRWARSQQCVVVGVAHSHPRSDPHPSRIDRQLADPALVTVILDGSGRAKGWWLPDGLEAAPVPVEVWDTEALRGG